MRERWFCFKGMAVFDHETKRFWHRNDIKELALKMWNDIDMGRKADNSDLAFVFIEEFDCYCDKETCSHNYWDDGGRWERITLPYHIGFGIMEGDIDRFKELVKLTRGKKNE